MSQCVWYPCNSLLNTFNVISQTHFNIPKMINPFFISWNFHFLQTPFVFIIKLCTFSWTSNHNSPYKQSSIKHVLWFWKASATFWPNIAFFPCYSYVQSPVFQWEIWMKIIPVSEGENILCNGFPQFQNLRGRFIFRGKCSNSTEEFCLKALNKKWDMWNQFLPKHDSFSRAF